MIFGVTVGAGVTAAVLLPRPLAWGVLAEGFIPTFGCSNASSGACAASSGTGEFVDAGNVTDGDAGDGG